MTRGLALFPADQDPARAALLAARAQGCTCSPEVEIRELRPGVHTAIVAHDAWCALLRREDRN